MAEKTIGSQTSEFPASVPDFTPQSEAMDPASPDDTLAEGRDANKWSAELIAIAGTLGTGGRGEVTVDNSVPAFPACNIGSLRYLDQGSHKDFVAVTGVALTDNQTNYIYIDPATNTHVVNTTGFPTTPHIRLAIWDDAVGANNLQDKRIHGVLPDTESEDTTRDMRYTLMVAGGKNHDLKLKRLQTDVASITGNISELEQRSLWQSQKNYDTEMRKLKQQIETLTEAATQEAKEYTLLLSID